MNLDHEAIRIWCLIYLLRCKVTVTPELLRHQIAYTTGHCAATGKSKPEWWIGGFSTPKKRAAARERLMNHESRPDHR